MAVVPRVSEDGAGVVGNGVGITVAVFRVVVLTVQLGQKYANWIKTFPFCEVDTNFISFGIAI